MYILPPTIRFPLSCLCLMDDMGYKLLTCKGGNSGLVANGIVTTTGYHELMTPSKQRCRKYVFVVEVDTWAVSLDPEK